MLIKSKLAKIASVSILVPLVLAGATASAESLPCVQRAIDWNKIPDTVHKVHFVMVSLHSRGVASFSQGYLSNRQCTGRWGIGVFDCLTSIDYFGALLSDRLFGTKQPFDVGQPFPLIIDLIPPDSGGYVTVRQYNGRYDFSPQCVGDMLTGTDQGGDHWTISFQLNTIVPPPR